jgi:hypothetical protein
MVNHSTQSGRHPLSERGADLYSTPACAVEALLRVERLPHWVWEPAAGRGAIVKVLRDAGRAVIASDIVEYPDLKLHFVANFLTTTKAPAHCDTIITNPPYQIADKFARHALDLVPKVYLLLRLAFLESVRRTEILEGGSLARVHIFRNRLPFPHRDNWTGPRASSAISFAWFSWCRDHRGPATLNRISWKAAP